MKKNTLLTTLPSLPREWMVEFEFKPTNFDHNGWNSGAHNGWTSIFHMTTAPRSMGDRIPAGLQCSITPEGLFTIISHDNQNGNYHQNFPPPPIGKWTKIRVSQELIDGKFRYRIFILAFILLRLRSYTTVSPKKTYHIFPWNQNMLYIYETLYILGTGFSSTRERRPMWKTQRLLDSRMWRFLLLTPGTRHSQDPSRTSKSMWKVITLYHIIREHLETKIWFFY